MEPAVRSTEDRAYRRLAIQCGRVLLRSQEQVVKTQAEQARMTDISGINPETGTVDHRTVPAANATVHRSETAALLLANQLDAPFTAVYSDNPQHTAPYRNTIRQTPNRGYQVRSGSHRLSPTPAAAVPRLVIQLRIQITGDFQIAPNRPDARSKIHIQQRHLPPRLLPAKDAMAMNYCFQGVHVGYCPVQSVIITAS